MPPPTRCIPAIMVAGCLLCGVAFAQTAAEPDSDPLPPVSHASALEKQQLALKAQGRRLGDARLALDDLRALAEQVDAAAILLGEEEGSALIRALRAVDVAPSAVSVAPAPAKTDPVPGRKKPAQKLGPLLPAGAWVSETPGVLPKAILVGDGKHHIVFLGEHFNHGRHDYQLTAITARGKVAGGQTQFAIVLKKNGKTTHTLIWPEGD